MFFCLFKKALCFSLYFKPLFVPLNHSFRSYICSFSWICTIQLLTNVCFFGFTLGQTTLNRRVRVSIPNFQRKIHQCSSLLLCAVWFYGEKVLSAIKKKWWRKMSWEAFGLGLSFHEVCLTHSIYAAIK